MKHWSKGRQMCKYSPQLLAACTVGAGCMLVFVAGTWADAFRRKAHCSPALPNHNYQSAVTPVRGTVASYPVQISSVPSEPNTTRKTFQPLENELTAGDCSLSNLRLQLYSDGKHILSFRATNTAHSAEPAQPRETRNEAANERKKARREEQRDETGVHPVPVRHHEFLVKARLFSGAPLVPAKDKTHSEGVVIGELIEGPFWVSAGEEVTKWFQNTTLSPRQYHEATNVEFELEVDPEYLIRGGKPAPIKRASRCGCPVP